MITFDLALKTSIELIAQDYPAATINALGTAIQRQRDYMLKVFNADIGTQLTIRDAAAADSSPFGKYLHANLTALLSPLFRVISTRLDVPVNPLPTSIGQSTGTIIVEDTTGFPTAGKFLIHTSHGQQVVTYTGKMQGQDFGSFTGCTGGSGSAGQGAPITPYVPGVDMSASAVRARGDLFIAAFTRRSRNAIGALNFINDKHVWSWDP